MPRLAIVRFAPGVFAAALAGFSNLAQADVDAEIRALKERINALEAEQRAAKAAAAVATPAAPAAAPAASAAKAGDLKIGDTRFSFGGFVKLDVLHSRFSEGEVAQSTSRDYYVPGNIPVSTGRVDARSFTDFHAKSSRLFFKTETPFDGHKVGTHVEFDFIVNQSTTANERVTNAYTPGFRRAFVTFDNWLAGQDWTTFQNLSALPESLDFVEFPSEGTVFVRQAQIRYTTGGLMFALENPETAAGALATPADGGAPTYSVTDSGDAVLPDAVARYTYRFGTANEVSLSGLVRQLKVENAGSVDDRATGGGASLAGKLVFGQDDLKFMLSGGKGIGRYLALGTSADVAIDADGELEAIRVIAGYVAYKHAWTPQWRSTLLLSAFDADNDTDLTGTAVTKKVHSAAVNLLYSPVPKLTFGAEFRHAEREVESGADGSLDRLQFSARYNF